MNCGLRIADCGLRGLRGLLLVALWIAPAQAQQPADEARTTALGSAGLVEKGSDIDRALTSGEWEVAEQLLVKKIEAAPQSAELLKLLARVFLADRRPLNAAIAFKKAEAIAPLDTQARYELAIAYLSMDHGDWARPELERLAQADPANPLYQYWLGRVEYDAGQYGPAAKRFQDVIDADDTFTKAYDNLGLCYEALNQPEQAIAAYRKAIALNQTAKTPSAWPLANLGKLLRTRGELVEAETLLRDAVRVEPSSANAQYQLGVLLEQQEHLDDAVVALRHAADSDPAYPDPHYALARIYRRQNKQELAAQAMSTFQRLRDAKRGTPGKAGGAEAPPPQ